MTRLVLAPGLRVLDRGPWDVQIGITPGAALRVPAGPAVRRALDLLEAGETVPGDLAPALAPALVDADALAPEGVDPRDAAAAALHDPAGFAWRLHGRRAARVLVLGDLGHPGTDPRPLLTAAGVGLAAASEPPDAVLLLATEEPDRALLDPLVRDEVPHLLVRAVEGTVVVGPLVEPGRTACLRCLDAHHAVDDPLYPALVAVHHRAERQDGVAEPVDGALAVLAVAWAVRDLVTHLDGERAATWSATVHAGPHLADLAAVQWQRHPDCGCRWT
ncbi:MAG: hypothetical protein J7518_08755 [Nocardioidaceae bacterium]|nr:hypothetical protein [Nocardioidaceae bacterium]